jgi:lysozyme family protein
VIDRERTVRQLQRTLRPARAIAVDGIVACLHSLRGPAS